MLVPVRSRTLTGLALAVVVCSLAACSGDPAVAPATVVGPDSADSGATLAASEHDGSHGTEPVAALSPVTVGSRLAQIRGHHRVALELHQAGDQPGALVHTAHPAGEILPALRDSLADQGTLPDDLQGTLELAERAVQGTAPEELVTAVATAAELTREAERRKAGEMAGTTGYRASVIVDLLATAGREYEEGVADGQVRELVEYQDAYGFVAEARALYGAIAGDVEAADAQAATAIGGAFERLGTALAAPQPPAAPASPADVQADITAITSALVEDAGARAVDDLDPAAEVHAIEDLLDAMMTALVAGQTEQAAELAAQAYLDHYEVIEPQVIAAAPDVNNELEPLLGAELRRQIQAGAGATEIQAQVERAKTLLAAALAALEGT